MFGAETIDGLDELLHRAVVRRRRAQFQVIGQFVDILLPAAPSVAPYLVDIEVIQDAPQPPGKPLLFAQLGFLAQRPLDAVLHQIVRQRRIARQRHGIAPQGGKLRHQGIGEGGGAGHSGHGDERRGHFGGQSALAGEADLLRRVGRFGIAPNAFWRLPVWGDFNVFQSPASP